MLNRASIIGRVGRDPEVRTTSTGKQVAEFSVAVSRRGKGDDTDWFRVIVWGATADYVGNYIRKGRLVCVDGRMECRKFNDKDGNNRESWELIADNVSSLERATDSEGSGTQKPSKPKTQKKVDPVDEYDPFADE